MKMKTKMMGKLLMMAAVITFSNQSPVMASETQVTFQVPVSIRDVSNEDARGAKLVCQIGTGNRKSGNTINIQLVNGQFSRTVSVRVVKRNGGEPFKVGTPYNCILMNKPRHASWGNMGRAAKLGTRPITNLAGRL